jgi:metallo-beta-lactamase family protein
MTLNQTEFKITFLGAAGTVTGSKTLIELNSKKILIDSGLFQGLKEHRKLNRVPLEVNPADIDEIILTHAHLDHCGYLPVLVKNGFKGDIHCTAPTEELATIILKDSAKIQEEDAKRANEHNYSKHEVATPLYTQGDVLKTIKLFVTHDYSEWVILDNNVKFEFLNSGHILGSAFINLKVFDKTLFFSGDIGQLDPILMYPPKKIKHADYLIMEGTYGDRLHTEADVKEELLAVIEETYAKRGILMIPTFAVERAQEILYFIYKLRTEGRLPSIPVYLDSPMGIHATEVYDKYHELQNISKDEINHMYDDIHFVDSPEDSKRICLDGKPKIVLAGSGMIEGGRIIHYLNNHVSDKKNTVLFVGYQGEGTRGRSILKGSGEVKFFGRYHDVNCDIRSISSLSAHGDQKDIINWLKNIKEEPTKLFINHSEKHQSEALLVKIRHELGWECTTVPSLNQSYILS